MGSTEQSWAEWTSPTTAAAAPSVASAGGTEPDGSEPGGWARWNDGAASPESPTADGYAEAAIAAAAVGDTERAESLFAAAELAASSTSHTEGADDADDAWAAVNADIGVDPSAGFDTNPGYDMGAS